MRLVFLFALALFSAASVAKNDCEINILSHRQLMVFRMRNERTFEPSTILVRGKRYMLMRELGKSRSTAYLAMSPNGEKVLLKDYNLEINGPTSEQKHLFLREFVVTKFLRNRRIQVPRILDHDAERGIVVKEYAEGLLPWEYRSRAVQAFGVSHEEFAITTLGLKLHMQTIGSLNPSFANWIDSNTASALPRELRNIVASSQIRPRTIDVREDNFVYNFEQEKWILFDP